MNGRVYDPEIGRFMSVDPVFQFPENTQSLNPYSYVLNNPLSLTDPTGEVAIALVPAVIAVARAASAAYALYSGAQATTDAVVVVADETATPMQTALAVGEAAAGVADVTPGDLAKKSIAMARQAMKGAEKAAAKKAGEKAGKAGKDATKPAPSNGANDAQGAKSKSQGGETGPAKRDSTPEPGESQTREISDDEVVVKGGTKAIPPAGETFSGAAGKTVEDAAQGVPHGQIQVTTAGQIRAAGGTVEHKPELTRAGNLNEKHVNICKGNGSCSFGPPQPNPVPKKDRIE